MTLSDFGVRRKAETLANGIRLAVFERPGTPVAVEATFLQGARFDGENEHGLAHLAEHMLAAGTDKFPTKDQLALFIERLGGYFAASTGIQTINFSAGVGDPADWRQAVLVLSEMIGHSLLRPEVLQTERGSIIEELGAHRSQPGGLLSDAWLTTIFANTPAGRTILGTGESLNRLDLANVRSYVDRLWQSRCVIMASGGVTFDEVKTAVMEQFSYIQSPEIELSQLITSAERKKVTAVAPYDGGEQIRLAFGFKTCGTWHPDDTPLRLLGQILGGGRASSLTKILRYQRGLVYGIGAGESGFMDDGEWSVGTVCARSNVQEVLNVITDELERAKAGKITAQELQFVQDRLVKSKRGQMQTSDSWIDQHLSAEMFVPERDWTLIDYLTEVSSIKLEDIQRVAQTYFQPDSWYLVMCGNIDADEVQVKMD